MDHCNLRHFGAIQHKVRQVHLGQDQNPKGAHNYGSDKQQDSPVVLRIYHFVFSTTGESIPQKRNGECPILMNFITGLLSHPTWRGTYTRLLEAVKRFIGFFEYLPLGVEEHFNAGIAKSPGNSESLTTLAVFRK